MCDNKTMNIGNILKIIGTEFIILLGLCWAGGIATFIFIFVSEPIFGIPGTERNGSIFFGIIVLLAYFAYAVFRIIKNRE